MKKKSFIKILSVIFAITFVFQFFVATSNAQTVEKPVYIQISAYISLDPFYEPVYPAGNDFLMRAGSFAKYTDYECDITDKSIVFTRGVKQIVINTENGRMYTNTCSTVFKLSTVRRYDGSYYLPVSELFPRMNVYCSEKDGILYLASDTVSIWELISAFSYKDVGFDFLEECKNTGVNPNKLKVVSYVFQKGLTGLAKDKLMYIAPGLTYGDYKDYYDIFHEMFQDRESIYETGKNIAGQAKKLHSVFNVIEKGMDFDLFPDEIILFQASVEALNKIKAEECFEVLSYQETYVRDNVEKLAILRNIFLYRYDNDYPKAIVYAAMQAYDTYTDLRKGIETMFFNILLDSMTDLLESSLSLGIIGDALTTIDFFIYDARGKKNWKEYMVKMPRYNGLQDAACHDYRQLAHSLGLVEHPAWKFQGYEYTASEDIERLRLNALLYLYGARKGYETMQTYFLSKNDIKKANAYDDAIKRCNEWYARFLASSVAQNNDASGGKSQHTKYIKGLLKSLVVTKEPVIHIPSVDETDAFLLSSSFIDTDGMNVYISDSVDFDEFSEGRCIFKTDMNGNNRQLLCRDVGTHLTARGEWLYYVNMSDFKLYRVKKDGSVREKLSNDTVGYKYIEFSGESYFIPHMIIQGEWIYYYAVDAGSSSYRYDYKYTAPELRLYKMKTDGTGRRKLSDEYKTAMRIHNEWIYYLDDERKLCRMNTDGTGGKRILDTVVMYYYLEGDTIYYCSVDNELVVMNTTELQKKILAKGILDFLIHKGIVYYTIQDSNNITLCSVKKDGSGFSKIFTVQNNNVKFVSSFEFYPTDKWIYYIQDATKLYRCKPDGSGNTLLFESEYYCISDINVTNDKLYFTQGISLDDYEFVLVYVLYEMNIGEKKARMVRDWDTGIRNFQMAFSAEADTNMSRVFQPGTPVIYVTFFVSDLPIGTNIQCEWKHIGNNTTIHTSSLTTDGKNRNGHFSCTRPRSGWPAGEYEVGLFRNGEHIRSIKFYVLEVLQ